MKYRYYAVAEDGEDGSWSAYVPDLPGCTAGGTTAEEALDNVKISVELWLAEAEANGEQIPAARASVRQLVGSISSESKNGSHRDDTR